MKQTDSNVYENFINNMEDAAGHMQLRDDLKSILENPLNELKINFPVKRDNGNIEMFEGYRVQHNNMRGPFYGGMRFHPSVSLTEIKTLSMWMTLKCALLNIPLSGSAGGVKFNPQEYSDNEVERITRRFVFSLGSNVGADYDIIGPDINTNPQIMAWMLDTLLFSVKPNMRNANRHGVTGKPVELGGTLGHDEAIGIGVSEIAKCWAQKRGIDMENMTAAIQGFSRTGFWIAKMLNKLGVKIIAVESFTGAVMNSEGIDIHMLKSHLREKKPIRDFEGGKITNHKAFMSMDADIFIPAALENQINSDTVNLLNAKLIIEAANGATTPQADAVLQEKGIDLIPGMLGNSAVLAGSYFEWLQNKRSEFWSFDEFEKKLKLRICDAYERVMENAEHYKCSVRTAAFITALNRLQTIYNDRGIYP